MDLQILAHSTYVALVFAVLLFGALAFRQVLDNLDVRRMKLGEDRITLVSAPAAIGAVGALAAAAIIAFIIFRARSQSIYLNALPMILFAQVVQILLRVWMQRTIVKTRGIVVRPVLRAQVVGVNYQNITSVVVRDERAWVRITITSDTEGPCTFRIFRFSVKALEKILAINTTAEITHIVG